MTSGCRAPDVVISTLLNSSPRAVAPPRPAGSARYAERLRGPVARWSPRCSCPHSRGSRPHYGGIIAGAEGTCLPHFAPPNTSFHLWKPTSGKSGEPAVPRFRGTRLVVEVREVRGEEPSPPLTGRGCARGRRRAMNSRRGNRFAFSRGSCRVARWLRPARGCDGAVWPARGKWSVACRRRSGPRRIEARPRASSSAARRSGAIPA